MISAVYTILEGYGECKEVTGKGRTIEFNLGDRIGGEMYFAGKRAEVKDGRVKISLKDIPQGRYTPCLLTKIGATDLEPLVIMGEQALLAPTEERVIRLSLARIKELEEKEKKNKERIDELFTLIKGSSLFG